MMVADAWVCRVQKGDEVMIPIWLINRSKEIWGPDATEFRYATN